MEEEEDQDHPEEEDQDHPEEEDQDLLEEEEDQDLPVEGNPWPHNNQYHLHQMSKRWEASHKYSMETNLRPTISLKKSKAISASMLMLLDTTCHTRK